MEDRATYDIFAGTGGPRPAVRLLRDEQRSVVDVLTLPCGHSVYALDVALALHRAAVGTRAGAIHLLDLPNTAEPDRIVVRRMLIQGAPVLSVCVLGEGDLASTDTTGRCLLWNLRDEPDNPISLPVRGGQIGSLCRLADGTLAGVSNQGDVHLWNLTEGKLLRTVRGPVPSHPLALARLQYWPSQDVLVYPAKDGSLALFVVETTTIHTLPAHRGAFCAVAVAEGEIHTVGMQDGLLKTWRDVQGKPARTCRAPLGIVSAEALPGPSTQYVLAGANGEAGVYTEESGALRRAHRLEGRDYRAIAAASALERASFRRHRLLEEATALLEQIQARIESCELEGIDDLLARLEDNGFDVVALALRAHLAARQSDLIQELMLRSRLSRVLPRDGSSGVPSLQRYAQLLESAWQLAAAQEMCARTGSTGDSRAGDDWLVRSAAIMSGADWVVAPNASLPLLVRAATAVGQPFVGRWVLQAAKPMVIPVGGLTPAMIAAKYEQVRSEETRRPLPICRPQTTWWLAPHQTRQAEFLLFVANTPAPQASICPGMEVRHDEWRTLAIPMLLLVAASPRAGESVEFHNEAVLRCLEENALDIPAGAWPPAVRHAVGLALRRLRNQVKATIAS